MRTMATFVASAALASCIACGGDTAVDEAQRRGDETADMSSLRSTREDASALRQAVTLEGCLQRGGSTVTRGYLLTMVKGPSAVGTAGSVTATGSSVEREQLRMAATTYRLDPEDDVKLDDMIGRRVRVNGTVSELADLPNDRGRLGSDRNTQLPNRHSHPQGDRNPGIEVTDLAEVEVTSAAVIGESCADAAR